MKRFLCAAACAALLTGCSTVKDVFTSEDDRPLPGTRVSVLEMQRQIEPDDATLEAQGFIAPAPWHNEFWPQAGGYPNHAMQNLALNEGELKKVWSSSIGNGATKSLPLTAQPIVVDGQVYTLDSESKLSAFNAATGKLLWRKDVSDPAESDPVISGGVAYSQGQIYVTAGYDEVLALSPADGSLIWRVRIPAPSRAAPTAVDGRVFIATLDNRVIALNATDGQALWEYAGIGESTGLVGAASPAVSREMVVPAFSSGEIFALRVENGSVAWAENLSALSGAGGLSSLSDIHGLPVVDKGLVIAVSFGGRLVAIDERTGARVWQREIGGAETPWVVGNHLFMISTENELVALGRDTGAIRWVLKLPRFEDEEEREDPIFWTGPVLAGGRLIIAGTNGDIIEAAPEDGKIIRTWDISAPVTISPVVAAGVMYMLDDKGNLTAFQ
ncbi:MAG TPA: PQQ-binding-like beta-propeller repeat protein [Alphaproteobacteria bacterium]|jgi:outer membrane protein assembly factor BamB